jgi:DNA alkylation damage repair protein AlkB
MQRRTALSVLSRARAVLLRGFARACALELTAAIGAVAAGSPFRHMVTPGGWPMSVALTNCGQVGWITDRTDYRYDAIDPATGRNWPAMPRTTAGWAAEAAEAAGFSGFRPDACLINRYAPRARLSLHQDRNERDFDQPIVSVSPDLPAIFLWGGKARTEQVWGGSDRLTFHGVHALAEGGHELTGAYRLNTTLRRALQSFDVMPLQNRVTPVGDIVAAPERGCFTGNRGIIHDLRTHTLLKRRWASRARLICTLHWRDVRRAVMATRSWTELFFLDETTALAAGHRPCFFCRRAAARAYQSDFPTAGQLTMPKARDIDAALHAERLAGRRKRLHVLTSPAADLPDGAMILQDGVPHLMLGRLARPWSLCGYGIPVTPLDCARLITPPSTVAVLRAGYRPRIHVSASAEQNAGAV